MSPGAFPELHVSRSADSYERELQQLRADKELLDWMQEQAKKSFTGIGIDWCRHVEDGQVVEHGYRFMRHHFLGERKLSLRDAIRAAMQSTTASAGKGGHAD